MYFFVLPDSLKVAIEVNLLRLITYLSESFASNIELWHKGNLFKLVSASLEGRTSQLVDKYALSEDTEQALLRLLPPQIHHEDSCLKETCLYRHKVLQVIWR